MAKQIGSDSLRYNDETTMSLRETICNKKLLKLCMYGLFIAFAFRLPDVVMPIIGGRYFGSDDNDTDSDTNCSGSGNAEYAMWYSLSACIGGAVGFLVESYLGTLSDIYGRKRIMYFSWCTLFIGYTSMCFTNNVWYYLILFPFTSIAGLFIGIPTVLSSALSDCVIPKYKTTIFALLFGVAGFISILGSVTSALLVSYFNIKAPFYGFSITMIIALLWLIFVVEETLPKELRINKSLHNTTNPLKPLLNIKNNKIILWISIMGLFTAIPESGIDDMISSYTDDMLSLCDKNENKATTFNAMSGITMGCVMLISQFFILPLLSKYFNDILLLTFVLIAIFIFMLSGILLYFFQTYVFGLLFWGCFGLSFITSPIISGCLAKRLNKTQQGLGMGILHAMKGITFATAPYAFGGLYDLFDSKGFLKTSPFMLGIIFVLFGVITLFGPLKRVLNEYDDNKLREGLVPVSSVQVNK